MYVHMHYGQTNIRYKVHGLMDSFGPNFKFIKVGSSYIITATNWELLSLYFDAY